MITIMCYKYFYINMINFFKVIELTPTGKHITEGFI